MGQYSLDRPDEPAALITSDLQHEMWLLTLNGELHLSKLPATKSSILDVGCGNGIWTQAMAAAHPTSHVTGMDITPPATAQHSNIEYVKANAEEPWPFDGSFNFIHARMLVAVVRDWPTLLKQCWEYLEPGGRFELLDLVPPIHAAEPEWDNDASPIIKWATAVQATWKRGGLDWSVNSDLEKTLEQLGFVNITQSRPRWPIGTWSNDEKERKIGELCLSNFRQLHENAGHKMLLNKNSGMSEDEARNLSNDAIRDFTENCCSKRFFFNIHEDGQIMNGSKTAVIDPYGGLIAKGHPLGTTGTAQYAELD
ncbi:MAG: hypothetical protein Q9165_002216 [Trypethelium subeluteriae]